MRNLLIALASITVLLFIACRGEEACTKEMMVYEILTESSLSGMQERTSQTVVSSPLSGDVYVDGDAIIVGGLNTNGHSIEVTGHLIISGHVNLAQTSTIKADAITISGNVNLNGGEMWCNDIVISGGVNGSGYIYYCDLYVVTGNVNNNQPDSVFQNDCGNTLSNGLKWYYVGNEIVSCDTKNGTIKGNKKYIDINE